MKEGGKKPTPDPNEGSRIVFLEYKLVLRGNAEDEPKHRIKARKPRSGGVCFVSILRKKKNIARSSWWPESVMSKSW